MNSRLRKGLTFPGAAVVLVAWLCLLGGMSRARAQAAYDVFVRFGEPLSGGRVYKGGSTNAEFHGSNGWSRVLSVGQGALNPAAFTATGGGTSGKTEFPPISLIKLVDAGSPILFQACAAGQGYDSAQVVFRAQGPVPPGTPPFSLAKLETVYVTQVRSLLDVQNPLPTEVIDLVFGAVQWSVNDPDAPGAVDVLTANWSVLLNTGGAGPLPGLTLSPGSLTNGIQGRPFSQQFTASGTTGPYTYRVHGGALPPGLSLSGSGLLAGTPLAAGVFNFRIAGLDQNACFAERNYSVTVVASCTVPPRLAGMTVTNGVVRLRLEGTVGCSYQMQRADFVNGPWSAVGGVISIGAGGPAIFTETSAVTARFYRAINVP